MAKKITSIKLLLCMKILIMTALSIMVLISVRKHSADKFPGYIFDKLEKTCDDNGEKLTDEMKEIIDEMRKQIKQELEGYDISKIRSIDDLIPEKGGTPMRSIVVTSWRSGSSFTSGVINSHPATFHFYEPLVAFGYVQIRGEPLATPALTAMRELLSCNYNNMESYLKSLKLESSWSPPYNTRLWAHCKDHEDICFLPQFRSRVCRLFPFQLMKTVRIRLRLMEELLADPELNVKVLYLVRDPRGVMSSRSLTGWCRHYEDCSDTRRVCADQLDDYSAALRFTHLFPKTFKVVRYEDLAMATDVLFPEILNFFGLQYHEDVKRFLSSHTTYSVADKFSLHRNSSATALLWRSVSNHSEVKEIQRTCRVALSAWGYLPADNASQQLTFNPLVQPFTLP